MTIPTHAGIAVQAADTGRVLMQQRAMDPTDAPDVQGTWEFPGGSLEDGEDPQVGAWREWQEETGLDVPDHEITGGWASPNGVYQGYVATVPSEDSIGQPNSHDDGNGLDNPDDPRRDHPDVAAWFSIEHIKDMGAAVRPEVLASTDWSQFASTLGEDEGADMTATEVEPTMTDTVVPWHGILAPEGVPSGDGRMFAADSLSMRDLPLPLTWQKTSASGHDGSVTVARIDNIWREDGLMKAEGVFLNTAEAQEVMGLIAEFGRYGVSVDADSAVFEMGDNETVVFTSARIASASIVSIPAFAEAWVALGPWEQESVAASAFSIEPIQDDLRGEAYCLQEGCGAPGEFTVSSADPTWNGIFCAEHAPQNEGVDLFRDVSTDERKDLADSGAAMPDGSYPIANCDDLKNAIQAIGRAKDPDATKAHIRKRKDALGCPDVELPETWSTEVEVVANLGGDLQVEVAAAGGGGGAVRKVLQVMKAEEFVVTEDGPGWLTHPVDTDRLRDYWTQGEGAAKIQWGIPGDFDRCRLELAKYVKPEFLAGYCANRHYDALGFWPGRPTSGDTVAFGDSISLVAAAPRKTLPATWFSDPGLTKPTALTVTPEGKVFGHLATWGTCHIGFDGVCVEAPTSMAAYAYFRTGQVQTTDGPVATGNISMGGGHAGPRLGYKPAMAHYDSTSSVVADVACGEDEHGIWFSGAIRDGVSEEDVASLAASGGLSGDWRRIAGNLELVAALAVNVPGFPVPRVQVAASNGYQTALVAAGIVNLGDQGDPIHEIADEVEKIITQRVEARQRHAVLREKTHGERVAALKARLGED